MSFIFPALGALLQAGSVTVDKMTLSIKKFTYKNYTAISFPLIFIFNFIIYLIFRPKIFPESFAGLLFVFLLISIFLTLITNIIFYRALKSDGLGEIEVITMLNKVPIILVAGLFFADERNYLTLFLAFIAAFALVWSHWERHHFHIAKKTWPFLILSLTVSPFGAVLSKELLRAWDPISLQMVTNGVVGVFFLVAYRKHLRTTPRKAIPLLILTNLLTTVAWILFFFSYQQSGIVYTALIFSIQPALVYLASLFFLKEKHHWRKTIGFIIILITITLSQVLT